MAEFQEVMKHRKRMCDFYSEKCSKCELSSHNNKLKCVCNDACVQHPQQAEEIIMKWADEHPIQTNADKFKEVFGFEPSDRCINKKDCFETFCTNCKHKDFWKQEYKEPKGDF